MGIILGLSAVLCCGAADFLARYCTRLIGTYRTSFFMQFKGERYTRTSSLTHVGITPHRLSAVGRECQRRGGVVTSRSKYCCSSAESSICTPSASAKRRKRSLPAP